MSGTAMHRVYEHRRIWRLSPDVLRASTSLLGGEILREHGSFDHVIGITSGGAAPAALLAATLGVRARTVHARHNNSDAVYADATGDVRVDLAPLTRTLRRGRLTGRVVLIDDIAGSGATLAAVQHQLNTLTTTGTQVLTVTLCVNSGTHTLPDYSVWAVSDWVVFPWEAPPSGQIVERLPYPLRVTRHV